MGQHLLGSLSLGLVRSYDLKKTNKEKTSVQDEEINLNLYVEDQLTSFYWFFNTFLSYGINTYFSTVCDEQEREREKRRRNVLIISTCSLHFHMPTKNIKNIASNRKWKNKKT